MKLKKTLLPLGAVVISVLPTSEGWTLARWPNANTALGGNLANNVITISHAGGSGTGTVINVTNDPVGNGAWVCVVTADHVVRGATVFTVGFNNGQNYSNAAGPNQTTIWATLGPTVSGGLVDISVMGVRVPNRTLLPALVATVGLGGTTAGTTVTLAGYGDTNITAVTGGTNPPGPARSYQVQSTFGTYRSGTDVATNIATAYARGIYSFQALQGFLTFAPGAPTWPPTTGDAYVLSGDSGGPTFSGATLIGVHSGSQSRFNASNVEFVDEGDRWSDVDLGVAAHRTWVAQQCALVPEPSSLVALSLGALGALVGLARRRTL